MCVSANKCVPFNIVCSTFYACWVMTWHIQHTHKASAATATAAACWIIWKLKLAHNCCDSVYTCFLFISFMINIEEITAKNRRTPKSVAYNYIPLDLISFMTNFISFNYNNFFSVIFFPSFLFFYGSFRLDTHKHQKHQMKIMPTVAPLRLLSSLDEGHIILSRYD